MAFERVEICTLVLIPLILLFYLCLQENRAEPKCIGPQDGIGEDSQTLGRLCVESRVGGVTFRELEKAFQVNVHVSGDARFLVSITGERFQAWLLSKEGKAVDEAGQRRTGILGWVGNENGGTSNAIFLFKHDVARESLAGVVVAVDGVLSVFQIPDP
jgi:hypothetical protein